MKNVKMTSDEDQHWIRVLGGGSPGPVKTPISLEIRKINYCQLTINESIKTIGASSYNGIASAPIGKDYLPRLENIRRNHILVEN